MKTRLFIVAASTLAIVAAAIALSVVPGSVSRGQQNPPFTQCPHIGADTGCGILIVIDTDGGLRVHFDPSQPPYDQIEDTLIGVQNNSSNTVTSIPLNGGSNDIFGFDGDGLCTYITCTWPHPTGYEGPGVSLTPFSATSGSVSFAGGLAPGSSTYFSLEGAIQSSCPPINAPARLLQGPPSIWAGDLIGNSNVTIAAYGCYITSSAMMINYYAARQGKAFRTDPRQLNQYLTAHNGIDANGNVAAGGEALIAQHARANGVFLSYGGMVDHRDDFTLDQNLCSGQPPLLYVGSVGLPHWVFVTGQTTLNGTDTYSVLDPDSYPNGNTLAGGFNNTYGAIELYGDIVGPLQGLYVKAHSPVELVLTAPNGTQTGFDPLTNTRFSSIPSSGYQERSIANDQNHSLPPTPPVKTLSVVGPASGSYTLQVTGTGVGGYTIDVAAFDSNGNMSRNTVAGSTTPGMITRYQIGYSSVPNSPLTVRQVRH